MVSETTQATPASDVHDSMMPTWAYLVPATVLILGGLAALAFIMFA